MVKRGVYFCLSEIGAFRQNEASDRAGDF